MAASMNSNAPNAPAPAQNNPRRRLMHAATMLAVETVAKVVEVPVLKDSVRAAQGILGALKEPARNDLAAQDLIFRIDEIMLHSQFAGADEVCPEYLEDLQQIKSAVIELKNKPYRTKIACQRDIGKELATRGEETTTRALLFSVEGSVYGRQANARSAELEGRYERIAEAFATLQGELNIAAASM
ncbi:unnamed protein product [Rhizoctonia solani]|uniref:Uncharacterized protein n=1 Tax=Rhizoctonia solani TaxID=456999 RepID=A0A8H3DMI7_9AGAM|nr:unnamed protein product [Rhizoctonia solani]